MLATQQQKEPSGIALAWDQQTLGPIVKQAMGR